MKVLNVQKLKDTNVVIMFKSLVGFNDYRANLMIKNCSDRIAL